MQLCEHDCIPCCDFCYYSIHDFCKIDDTIIKGRPIGCQLHTDEEHQELAQGCCFCEDFYCFNAWIKNVQKVKDKYKK